MEEPRRSGARRVREAEDAVRFTGILLASWADPDCGAHGSDEQAERIFSRARRLIDQLLSVDPALGSWSERACQLEAVEKLGTVLTMLMNFNRVPSQSSWVMIDGVRQAAVSASRFCVEVGASVSSDVLGGRSSPPGAAAEAARFAAVLFSAADDYERYLGTLH